MPVNVTEIQKHKAPPPVSDINVTPMVDVMLVMLIIFMVITPMLSKGKDVDMYKSRNAIAMQAADKTDAIICAVTRDGKMYVNVDQKNPEQVPETVKQLLEKRPTDKTVFVKADWRAKYERVVELVDNLRAVGVDQLGLLTDQKGGLSEAPAAAPAGKQ
jgi:biopolymer transport protein ExbD/biopolymer transport protein TolR